VALVERRNRGAFNARGPDGAWVLPPGVQNRAHQHGCPTSAAAESDDDQRSGSRRPLAFLDARHVDRELAGFGRFDGGGIPEAVRASAAIAGDFFFFET